ncbi:MAG: Rpn family recombination-promoting nuclease/putative transposase [Planctomycetota bacterium]
MHDSSLDQALRRPHDTLFRGVFSHPARAAELLRASLPPEAVAAIRWRQLRPVPGSFVDERLREHITDMLFAAPLRHGIAHLYTVYEHRRRHYRRIALQVHRYVTQHLTNQADLQPRARWLPPVLPFVIHQGPRRFRAPDALSQLIDQRGLPEVLRRHQPELRLFVFDLQAHDLHGLGLSPLARLPLLHLQQVADRPDTGRLLEDWRQPLRELMAAPGGLPVFNRLVSYVAIVSNEDGQTLKRAYGRIHHHAEARYMTVAEQLIQEGVTKGAIEERRRLLRLLLTERFGDLPRAVERRLAAAKARDLDRWVKRLLVAGSLGEVLG